jgi:hypothetical protein
MSLLEALLTEPLYDTPMDTSQQQDEEDASFIDDGAVDVEENTRVLGELHQDVLPLLEVRNPLPPGSDGTMFFFDIETEQTTGEHRPVLLTCTPVEPEDSTAVTNYYGLDCIEQFCRAVFTGVGDDEVEVAESLKRKDTYIAHYGGKFDFLPILEWLYVTGKIRPQAVMRGNSVIPSREY